MILCKLTWTLWVGINWTMFADVAKTAPDGEASCCCCCCCWWWCNADDSCDCCDWCVELSSVLLCPDADSPPSGSRLEFPFSSTMLLSIATVLPPLLTLHQSAVHSRFSSALNLSLFCFVFVCSYFFTWTSTSRIRSYLFIYILYVKYFTSLRSVLSSLIDIWNKDEKK